MTKKVAILHTSFVFVNVEPMIKNLFQELLPDVEVIDFVDSTVLATVIQDGCITPTSASRMSYMAQAAEQAGADIIFSACSSLGPSLDVARQVVSVPVVKIDDAMAQQAAEKGTTIGVLATVPSTLGPTADLVEQKAAAMDKRITVHRKLCEGAFDVLMAGDRERHDQMVLDGALSLAPQVDLIVLAQASMARLAPMLSEKTQREVLSSPRLGIEHIKQLLALQSE